jgi:hypothetical protein
MDGEEADEDEEDEEADESFVTLYVHGLDMPPWKRKSPLPTVNFVVMDSSLSVCFSVDLFEKRKD